MHLPNAPTCVASANASEVRRFSELDIRSQFDHTCALVGGGHIVVRRNAADSETVTLNKRKLVAGGVAVVIASRSRPRLEIRMVEQIQHLRLQDKLNTLSNRKVFRDRQVVVPV